MLLPQASAVQGLVGKPTWKTEHQKTAIRWKGCLDAVAKELPLSVSDWRAIRLLTRARVISSYDPRSGFIAKHSLDTIGVRGCAHGLVALGRTGRLLAGGAPQRPFIAAFFFLAARRGL